ncbi:MAG: response regulator transcription factor [Piscinibacter sp.]|uniref:response regulator transcription factor n=1 Tax=Piscinibacter sp. TaxID=1903157 RepID=UPI003D1136C4
MRILMVDDDTLFASALQKALQRAGYAVDWIDDGKAFNASMRSAEYDCVLLDLGLPGVDGETCLKALRERNPGLSALVITARGGLMDRLRLLELGADDYLVKPVDLDEVAARVRAVTRRAQQARAGDGSVLSHGELKLQPARRTAIWKGSPIALTNREFWLLEALVRKKGQIVSRERLEEALYGWGDDVDSNTVEVYIHHLRRKLDRGLIKTVRGLGYHLAEEKGNESDKT